MSKIYQGLPYNKPLTMNPKFGIGVMDNNNFDGYVPTLEDFFSQAITLGLIPTPTSSGWDLLGNAGTDPNVNFLGTTDGENLIIQPDSGNVGIGTSSPTAKLTVAGDIYSEFTNDTLEYTFKAISSTDANISNEFRIEPAGFYLLCNDYTTNKIAQITGNSLDGSLVLQASNVGIGTASPAYKLDVVGSVDAFKSVIQSGVIAGDAYSFIGNINGTDFNNSTNYTGLLAADNDVELTNKTVGGATTINLPSAGGVSINTYSGSALIIDNNANVGIGATSPASKLTVDGGDIEVIGDTNGLILESPDNTRYRVTVANGGTLNVVAV